MIPVASVPVGRGAAGEAAMEVKHAAASPPDRVVRGQQFEIADRAGSLKGGEICVSRGCPRLSAPSRRNGL